MRIAVFHDLPEGGARRAVNEFSKSLKKNNKVDLYYTDSKRDKTIKDFFSNVFYFSFRPKEWSGGDWKTRLYKDTIELVQIQKLEKKIADIIDSKEYDVLIVNASRHIESPFILKNSRTYKVFYCHDPHYRLVYEPEITFPKNIGIGRLYYEKVNRFLRKQLDKTNIKYADLVIANSKFSKKMFEKSYSKGATVSYYGVDSKFFKPSKKKKDIDLLYIGSHSELDGYNLYKKIEKKLSKKIAIKFVATDKEWYSDRQIRGLYQRSKIVLCIAKDEPFGLIPLEAFSCGVPVLAVNEAGYKESVINKKTGFLLPKKENEFTKKINYLLSHEKKRREMGKQARKYVKEKWTWDVAAANLEKKIKSSLNSNK